VPIEHSTQIRQNKIRRALTVFVLDLIEQPDELTALQGTNRLVANFWKYKPLECCFTVRAGAQFATFTSEIFLTNGLHRIGVGQSGLRFSDLFRFRRIATLFDFVESFAGGFCVLRPAKCRRSE